MTKARATERHIEPCTCIGAARPAVHGFVWMEDCPWGMYLATLGFDGPRPRIDLALAVYAGGTLGLSVVRDVGTLRVSVLDDTFARARNPVSLLGPPMDIGPTRTLAPGIVDTVRAIVVADRRLRMHVLEASMSLVVLEDGARPRAEPSVTGCRRSR